MYSWWYILFVIENEISGDAMTSRIIYGVWLTMPGKKHRMTGREEPKWKRKRRRWIHLQRYISQADITKIRYLLLSLSLIHNLTQFKFPHQRTYSTGNLIKKGCSILLCKLHNKWSYPVELQSFNMDDVY